MSPSQATELEIELRFFNQHRHELFQAASGKFALVKGEEVLGTFESETEAIRNGYEKLGNVPFLVKRITEADIPLSFTSFNLGV
jgi:hypothetical protein